MKTILVCAVVFWQKVRAPEKIGPEFCQLVASSPRAVLDCIRRRLELVELADLPAFFGPVITGEQRQLKFVVRLRVLPGQREPALPTSAFRHPSQP